MSDEEFSLIADQKIVAGQLKRLSSVLVDASRTERFHRRLSIFDRLFGEQQHRIVQSKSNFSLTRRVDRHRINPLDTFSTAQGTSANVSSRRCSLNGSLREMVTMVCPRNGRMGGEKSTMRNDVQRSFVEQLCFRWLWHRPSHHWHVERCSH